MKKLILSFLTGALLLCMACIGFANEAELPTPVLKEAECVAYGVVGFYMDNIKADYEIYRSNAQEGNYVLLDTVRDDDAMHYSSYEEIRGEQRRIICRVMSSNKARVFFDTTAGFGETWHYKIRRVEDHRYSEFSNVVSALSSMEATQLHGFAKSDTEIKLSWAKLSNAQGYYLYRKSGSSWKLLKKIKKGGTTSFVDKKVKGKKTYTYRIRAYRKHGKSIVLGAYSKSFKITTKAPKVKGNYNKGSVYGPSLSSKELLEVKRVVYAFKTNYIVKGMSSYDKVVQAVNYLRTNCRYAYRGWQYNRANTAWGALVYGEAQCSGYARALKALCDSMGVPCYYVHANSASANPSHQWNQVKVNGKWYIVDAQGGIVFVSGKQYTAMTGMKWNKKGLPSVG